MAFPISVAVEGIVDEAILARLAAEADAELARVFGREGKAHLIDRLPAYNQAAAFAPWVVLIDLNSDYPCAPEFVQTHLPAPSSGMCLRLACRQVEAWLLADRDAVAGYLSVAASRVPLNPDTLVDAKDAMLELARRSRSSVIRDDMLPMLGSGRRVGPLYAGRLIEFATSYWRPSEAASGSDSLRRCRMRMAEQVGRWRALATGTGGTA